MEQIKVNSTPAVINFNFEAVRDQLSTELQKYDTVVTEDTVKDAKKLAAELNKRKKEIADYRKKTIKEVSEPITVIEGQFKQLEGMCKDGYDKLTDQVKKFESERLQLVESLLWQALTDAYSEQNVDLEYQRANVDGLVLLTHITKTDKLTAGALSKINERVAADRSLQEQTKTRLLMLENTSYKANLASPLTRAHVESFLFDDDENYNAKLNAIIQSELEREQATREKARAEAVEQMRFQQPQAEPIEPETAAVNHAPTEDQTVSVQHTNPQPGMDQVEITAIFKLDAPAETSNQTIENTMRKMLDKAGFTSLDSISIRRKLQEVA